MYVVTAIVMGKKAVITNPASKRLTDFRATELRNAMNISISKYKVYRNIQVTKQK